MKLYKLRSLTTSDELSRGKDIINTNKFWCSRFHEMNDPMEGVYNTYRINIIEKIYDEIEQIDDAFSNFNIQALYIDKENDFNDLLVAHISKKYDLQILSDDKDFQSLDVKVVVV